ncbi:hypothetical protein H3146_23240 [Streptomyces sp. OF3]|uniref:Uncharacterized protein n=1 Tax=Streptomyces alkaliterrae TaxID=2213162 RepID=A0A7W3WPQ0_9ACTN|nr:hypothetical protein [Streptomyces alkaliterrae]MBB1256247.1 hypothetical protein [Streptomyces alkaliterrae]MBB1261208.1 hypothetical protein [Streptomyces alkaliterrae]
MNKPAKTALTALLLGGIAALTAPAAHAGALDDTLDNTGLPQGIAALDTSLDAAFEQANRHYEND